MPGRSRKATFSPVDIENRIIANIRCVECGTPLRGILVDSPCPQCGHPASDSVWGDYLIYADRARLDRLDEGARIVLYAGVATGVLVGVATIGMVVAAATAEDAIRRAFDTILAGLLVYPVIAITGIMLLTRRYSVAYYEARYFHARTLARAGIATGLSALLVAIGAYYLPHGARCLLVAAWATLPTAAFMRGLSRLLRRVPNLRLAGTARTIAAGICLAGLVTFAAELLRPQAAEHVDWEAPLIATRLLASWAWIGLAVGSLRLMVALRRNFQVIRGSM